MTGRLYDRRQWHRVKTNQLRREPFCRACKAEGKSTLATEVDHVTPISKGGARYDSSNLQSLCASHHSTKTNAFDMKDKDWRQWEYRGCFPDGSPRDPDHPWYRCGDAEYQGEFDQHELEREHRPRPRKSG
jgi:5-methylcytosine-specific restriction enzyme A